MLLAPHPIFSTQLPTSFGENRNALTNKKQFVLPKSRDICLKIAFYSNKKKKFKWGT